MSKPISILVVLAFLGAGACSSAAEDARRDAQHHARSVQSPIEREAAPVTAAHTPTEAARGYDLEPAFKKIFADGHDGKWFKADFVYVDSTQRTGWEADHIIFNEDGIEMLMLREPKELQPNTGAEYQRRGRYHYGRYEVVMRAAPGSGLVSSIFTHTGPSQNGDPHDEIDIEFLGHRTEELHINYFTDGRMAGSTYIKLPYDAAEEFQLYAFEWEPKEIRWYVGDQLVFTARDEDHPIPQTPGRLIMNLWTGSERQYAWHGRPTFQSGSTSGYYCASFVPTGDEAPQCSDSYSFDLPPVELGD
ncbi:MAG: family 16 glycosylhydrolase [Pseudomonadota bacterium]